MIIGFVPTNVFQTRLQDLLKLNETRNQFYGNPVDVEVSAWVAGVCAGLGWRWWWKVTPWLIAARNAALCPGPLQRDQSNSFLQRKSVVIQSAPARSSVTPELGPHPLLYYWPHTTQRERGEGATSSDLLLIIIISRGLWLENVSKKVFLCKTFGYSIDV